MDMLSDFCDAMVSLGQCNHANAVMDDWDGKDFYIYKHDWAIFKASREYITVDMPPVTIDMYGQSYGYYCASEAMAWARAAIEEQGIRTK